uniref:Uncharacterized protein n=1 Tax=viral metagenome TaxID=1070528 RepID=A0A6C0BCL5_9ZZZZ
MNYFANLGKIKVFFPWKENNLNLEIKNLENEKKENEKKINCFIYKPRRKTFFDKIFEDVMKNEINKRIEDKKTERTSLSLSLEKKIQTILNSEEKEKEKEKEKDIIPSVFFCLSIPAMVMAYLYIFRNRR